MKYFIKNNFKKIIVILIILIFFSSLFYMFPYNSDDWGKKGLELKDALSYCFELWKTYNGRFFGNVLACLFKYSDIFKSIFSSLIMLLLINVLAKFIEIKKFYGIILTFLLFIVMPLGMFKDTISWMSSFVNFVIPGICIGMIIYISRDIFSEKDLSNNWYHILIAILCGMFMNMFSEHNSIFSVLLAFGLIGSSYFIKKRVSKTQICFLISSIVFCVLTFLSPAYWGNMPRLANAGEWNELSFIYKSIYTLKKTCFIDALTYQNLVLNFIIGFLFLTNLKKFKTSLTKILVIILLCTLYIVYPLMYFNTFKILLYKKVLLLFMILYFGIIIYLLYYLFFKKKKLVFYKLICLFLSVFIVASPLLMSYRIGYRCFFSSYVLLIIFAYCLANELFIFKPKVFNILIVIGSIFASGLMGYVTYKNYLNKLEIKRVITYNKSIKNKNIILPQYPYKQIIRLGGIPINDEQYQAFINYYKLNDSYQLYFVSPKEYQKNYQNKYFSDYINITTYDGSGEATHPSIIKLNKKVSGYKYWLVLTPLPNDNPKFENPSILVSNSGLYFDEPNGITNPIACTNREHFRDYCSDPYITYINDQFEVWYRFNPYKYQGEESKKNNSLIFRKTSKDGIHWSDKELIFDKQQNQAFMSISTLYSDQTYHVWYVNYDNNVYYRESKNLKKWSNPKKININNFKEKIWHGEIRNYNGIYYYLAYTTDSKLLLLKSNNGIDFTLTKEIDTSFVRNYDNDRVYKSSMLEVNDKVYLYVPYNKKRKTNKDRSHWSMYLKIYDKKDFYN